MGAKKKLRNRVYDQVLAGVITPAQGRAMVGKKPLPAPRRAAAPYRAPGRQGAMAVKSAGQARAPGGQVPTARLDHLAESSNPMDREPARTRRYALDGRVQTRVPPLPGLVREAAANPDPWEREAARAAVSKSMTGPAQPDASVSVRGLTWSAGPEGQPGWQRTSQPGAPGLQIAVPGTVGR